MLLNLVQFVRLFTAPWEVNGGVVVADVLVVEAEVAVPEVSLDLLLVVGGFKKVMKMTLHKKKKAQWTWRRRLRPGRPTVHQVLPRPGRGVIGGSESGQVVAEAEAGVLLRLEMVPLPAVDPVLLTYLVKMCARCVAILRATHCRDVECQWINESRTKERHWKAG